MKVALAAGVPSTGSRRTAWFVVSGTMCLLAALLLLSGYALANPSPPNSQYTLNLFTLIVITLATNLPPNLSVIEGLIYLGLRSRGLETFRSELRGSLVLRMIAACVVVSFIGGFIDLFFLGSHHIAYNPVLWLIALALIFVSVLVPMFLLVRASLRISALAGLVDIAVNTFFWSIFMVVDVNQGITLGYMMVIGGVLVSFALGRAIMRWFDEKADEAVRSEANRLS